MAMIDAAGDAGDVPPLQKSATMILLEEKNPARNTEKRRTKKRRGNASSDVICFITIFLTPVNSRIEPALRYKKRNVIEIKVYATPVYDSSN
mmetsp:Transcript_15063/g.19679  ORF Transcript_15063/g.19679 Transcript_15063/m.19679 type:complete len:92 (-) Transcript_15063:844-1119(-)